MRSIAFVLLALACPSSGLAQFELTEVSGPGSEPLRITSSGWSWEDLSADVPGVSYTVYRRQSELGFACIASNLEDHAWSGDPEQPQADELWWYQVAADDGWRENRIAGGQPIIERCACSGTSPSPSDDLALEFIADFEEPMHLTAAASDRTRIYVVERPGRIRVHDLETAGTGLFLDIGDRVRTCGEQGLLALAFHPDFESNGRFFVYYNAEGGVFGEGVARIAEFSALDADRAEPASERVIFTSDRPTCFHVGGQIAFGPHDGFLYVGLGEGDQPARAQDLGSELGKILRLDVDGAEPYEVPPDNPFVGQVGALPETWAYGLRNPWRFSFDSATGDLYIGDVGDSCSEEISVGLSVRGGGENYGWDLMEGTRCADPGGACDVACEDCPGIADCSALTMPVVDYDNITFSTCAVIGGHVYRGCRLPAMAGRYFYSDWCDGTLRSFVLDGGAATEEREWRLGQGGPVSFGEDARGELYLLSGDAVFRLGPG